MEILFAVKVIPEEFGLRSTSGALLWYTNSLTYINMVEGGASALRIAFNYKVIQSFARRKVNVVLV